MTIPPEAVTAAKKAFNAAFPPRWPTERMCDALDAAAPHIAAAERDRCIRLAMMTAENFADDPCMAALRKFADLLAGEQQ